MKLNNSSPSNPNNRIVASSPVDEDEAAEEETSLNIVNNLILSVRSDESTTTPPKPKPKSRLLNEVADSLLSSRFQGVSHIMRSKNLIIRVMWAMFLFASALICLFLVYESVSEYLKYDVVTKTRFFKVFCLFYYFNSNLF